MQSAISCRSAVLQHRSFKHENPCRLASAKSQSTRFSGKICCTRQESGSFTNLNDLGTHVFKSWLTGCATRISALVLASLLTLSAFPSNASETHTVSLPLSRDPEILTQQATMLEAFFVVKDLFYDLALLSQNAYWDGELEKHMLNSYYANDKESAYSEIAAMLDALEDPYTRIVSPECAFHLAIF